MRPGWACLLLACWAAPVFAELDAADYQVDEVIRSKRQRERIRDEIDREIDQQAQRERREADEEVRQRAEAEAAEARRPYPERLLKARCTLCHPPNNYLNQAHTMLGWHVVIARMRWLNRAPLEWDEQFVVAAELARLRPAAAGTAAIEFGLGAGAAAVPTLAGWAAWRWMRRRRQPAAAAP